MDFTNINDPAGVKALLEQLRTSQAWQELKEEQETSSSSRSNVVSHGLDITHSPSSEPEAEPPPVVSNHISSLLSRLQPGGGSPGPSSSAPSSWTPNVGPSQRTSHAETLSSHVAPLPNLEISYPPPVTKDNRYLNFNQALLVIARLSEDTVFMEKLEKLREDQTCLERKLWEERSQIIKSQEEKIRVAQTKASMVGTGLSQRDAKALQISFEKELRVFDSEQVLAAWDALVAKQQAALEMLGVPSMFTTSQSADREKQQRIIHVLDGLSDPADDKAER